MPDGLSSSDGSYRSELFRKGIHLCSLLIPVFYYFATKTQALWVLIPMTAMFIIVDVARYYSTPLREVFMQTFGWMLRKHEADSERKRLNGASFVLISATLCVLVFPKIITITSFSVLIISDLMAALIGKRFGKHKFLSKSWEGSLAFLLSGFVVILLTPKIGYYTGEYLIGFAAVVIGTLVEAFSIWIDDNLSIPISVGLTMWLLYFLAFPMLDIFKLG